MQLQDQGVARNQALVFGAAVGAAAAEQILVPPAARLDVADSDKGLWTQLNLCTLGPPEDFRRARRRRSLIS
jgi:hypothetical protein